MFKRSIENIVVYTIIVGVWGPIFIALMLASPVIYFIERSRKKTLW